MAWGLGKVSPGEIAFNELLALTIATVIVSVLLFVLSLTAVGAVIVVLISIVDLILELAGVDFTIIGTLTEALAGFIYRFRLKMTYEVETGGFQVDVTDPGQGFVDGNHLDISLPITTQLRASTSNGLTVHSLVYELDEQKRDVKAHLGEREDDYTVRLEEPPPRSSCRCTLPKPWVIQSFSRSSSPV